MICPKCKEDGTISTLYVGTSSSTLMGHAIFYDEQGVYHSHDPNNVCTSYQCSNGHRFMTSGKNQCPNCSYGNESKTLTVF